MIDIYYGVLAPGASGELLTPCDTMEQALTIATPEDSIWLCSGPLLGKRDVCLIELPAAFNRCVNVNGQKINSAVLRGAEVERHGNELPLPDQAPFLIVNIDRSEVEWLPKGIGGPVVRYQIQEDA